MPTRSLVRHQGAGRAATSTLGRQSDRVAFVQVDYTPLVTPFHPQNHRNSLHFSVTIS